MASSAAAIAVTVFLKFSAHIVCDTTPDQVLYLLPTEDGHILSKQRDYYYQIQGQLGILLRWRCNFVCWTPHGIHIEQIIYDPTFFTTICVKLELFCSGSFSSCALWCRKKNIGHSSEATGVFCYCWKGKVGKMVLCDNPSCTYSWFHFSRVNLKSAPEGP